MEKTFIKYCYKIIGIDFPDRGFLIFVQTPINDKLKYFEIEPQILSLKEIQLASERKEKLNQLLAFLGSDPILKVDNAFKAEYKKGIRIPRY
jgi:phosphoglucomutase/phosphomannomutase